MIPLYIFIVIVALIIILIIVAHFNDVKVVNLREGKIEFWKPRKEKTISFRPCFSIDPVISRDGKVYKVHLMVSILLAKDLDITNWMLKINRLKKMVFKQYFFQDGQNNRNPLGKLSKLQIQDNKSFVIGLEFEPEKDYIPFTFGKKAYKAQLICHTSEGSQKFKFKFRVRERNLKVIEIVKKEAMRDNQPKVIFFPIV